MAGEGATTGLRKTGQIATQSLDQLPYPLGLDGKATKGERYAAMGDMPIERSVDWHDSGPGDVEASKASIRWAAASAA